MKKLLLLMLGVITAIVALCMIGPIFGMLFSAAVTFISVHYYMKATSLGMKIFWIVIGLIGIFSAIGNVPGLIGLAAIVVLYVLYKNWNKDEMNWKEVKENDPFTNFENEWSKLTK